MVKTAENEGSYAALGPQGPLVPRETLRRFRAAIAALLASQFLLNCSPKTEEKNVDAGRTYSAQEKNLTELILGEWACCQTTAQGTVIKYNICPRVVFLDNNLGVWVDASAERFPFGWEVVHDSVLIISNASQTIRAGNYRMKYGRTDNYIDLELEHSSSDLIYSLNR